MRTTMNCVVCCIILISLSCQPRDNPYDPGRCDPRCQDGEVCFEGSCIKPDGASSIDGASSDGSVAELGTADLAADGGATEPRFVFKKCVKTGGATTTAESMGAIPCDDGNLSLTVNANGTDRYLFILSAPNSWLECGKPQDSFTYHGVATFGIYEGENQLAALKYEGPYGQRIPINVTAVKALSAGTHTITAKYARSKCDKLKIGGSPNWLIAVRAAPDDLQYIHGPKTEQRHLGNGWYDMNISSDETPTPYITVPKPGGDYLLILNAGPNGGNLKGAQVLFAISRERGGEEVPLSPPTLAIAQAGANYQHVPTTLVMKANLQEGDVLKPKWGGTGGQDIFLSPGQGVSDATWLVALRMPVSPTRFVESVRTQDTATSTTSKDSTAIPDLPQLSLSSTGADYLLAFTAPNIATCAYAPYYAAYLALRVDGASEATSAFSSHGNSDLYGCQRRTTTFFAMKSLPAGQHNIEMQWATTQSPEQSGKVWLEASAAEWRTRIIALTRQ